MGIKNGERSMMAMIAKTKSISLLKKWVYMFCGLRKDIVLMNVRQLKTDGKG